jgi:hypothetical protein
MDWKFLLTSYDGRINRAKFWAGIAVLTAIHIVAEIIDVALGLDIRQSGIGPVTIVIALAAIYPQFALYAKTDIADFIQEHGPMVGQLKDAGLVLFGAGEGAPGMPEELAFQQVGTQRGTVDGKENLVFPPAVGVDGPRDELFAGAALTADEHGGVGWGHFCNHRNHLPDFGTISHQLMRRGAQSRCRG